MTLRKIIRVAAAIRMLTAAAIGTLYWYHEHFWPFFLGSADEAFLGTTFGMSLPEVQRTLRKHNTKLVSFDEYSRLANPPLIERFDFTDYMMSDEREFYDMYMPSIEMFGGTTEADFEFNHSRL